MFISDNSIGTIIGANKQYALFVQNGEAVLGAGMRYLTALTVTVMRIIGMGGNAQVVKRHAAGNVAGVHQDQAIWNWPVMQSPFQAMDATSASFVLNGSVPARVNATHPYLATGPWNALAVLFNVRCVIARCWSWHDASSKTVEISPVSRVLARRGLQPVVPATQG